MHTDTPGFITSSLHYTVVQDYPVAFDALVSVLSACLVA